MHTLKATRNPPRAPVQHLKGSSAGIVQRVILGLYLPAAKRAFMLTIALGIGLWVLAHKGLISQGFGLALLSGMFLICVAVALSAEAKLTRGKEDAKRKILTAWVRAGRTDDEQYARAQFLQSGSSLDGALMGAGLAAATFAPLVNVDGTPMAGLVDIEGNPFGAVSLFSDDSFRAGLTSTSGLDLAGDLGLAPGTTSTSSFGDD